jgi:DNA mismatch repair protein MutL
MARITYLPSDVINAIAAGETIERPGYVIKELLENSLDAQATHIDITFSQAGLEHIRVHDNGIGMPAEDLALAPLAHTTSKISSMTDLEQLSSFGFRGEALASISKVSVVTLASKQPQTDAGHMLQVRFGKSGEVSPRGMQQGTTIIVEQLFGHTPVRKKFLNNLSKERRLIQDIVLRLALANPAVGFSLKDGKKALLDVPSGQDLTSRIDYLFDTKIGNQLLPISFDQPTFKIHGFIGKPQLAKQHAKHQHVFVNKRSISFPIISTVIKKAYGSLLKPGFSPWFVLHLEMPATIFDANVHPRKETVAFLNESQVIQLVNASVVETLSSADLSFEYQPTAPPPMQLQDRSTPLPELHAELKQQVTPWTVKALNKNKVLQIDNTYLIFPEENGYTVIDQHAAHERILFEQFAAVYNGENENKTIPIEPAFILNLTPEEDSRWQEQTDTLQEIGFKWETFGPNSYSITQVPSLLGHHDLDEVIPQVLDDISANLPLTISNQSHRTLAYLACRSAVMAGDPLGTDEAIRLIEKLQQTPRNATCPHGRPTRIHFSKDKLEKIFNRR